MKYAVVEIMGTQYKVEEGKEYLVALHGEKEKVDNRILLYRSDKKLEVGMPEVKGVSVKLTNLGPISGEKLYIAKYRAKSRYRKRVGFRPKYTKILVEKLA